MANYARNLQPVFPSVFDAAVGDIERLPPGNAQDFRRLCRLACSIFCRAPRAHLALSEVENAGPVSAVGHLEQGPATCLLNVIAVRGNGEDIERTG